MSCGAWERRVSSDMSAGGTETATPRKTTLQQEIVSLISYLLIAAAVAFFLIGLLGSWLIVLIALLYPLSRFGVTLVHEIGHAIGALLVGWRVAVITVWPVALHVPTGKIIVSNRVNISDGGGYLFSTPAELSRNRAYRFILIIMAGPLASLAMGVCMLWLASSQFSPRPAIGPEFNHAAPVIDLLKPEMVRSYFCVAVGFALMNFSVFIRTIVPRPASAAQNDGRMILDLLRNRERSAKSTVLWIEWLLHFRARLRDIPDWMYDAARAENSKAISLPPIYDQWDIARALDAETVQPGRVRALIESYRATYGNNNWLLNCDAWLAAVHENDVECAENALALRQTDSGGKAMHAAAEAAVAARRGQHDIVKKSLWWLDQELHADSIFPNATFRDIRKTIEAIAASTPAATA